MDSAVLALVGVALWACYHPGTVLVIALGGASAAALLRARSRARHLRAPPSDARWNAPSLGDQIVGKSCTACAGRIVSIAEGARCAACGEPCHTVCAAAHAAAAHAPVAGPFHGRA